MQINNTALSAIRHLLTTVGGALTVSPDPRFKAAGAILVAIGGLWGTIDEYNAENTTPPSTPSTGATGGAKAVAIAALFALLGVGASMTFTACTTTATSGVSDKQAAITAGVLNLAGTSVAPVLKNNPEYIPVAQAVYDGLGTISTSSIDAKTISEWVAAIGKQKNWNSGQVAYAQTVATSAWSVYTSYTGETSATVSDPKIQSWIAAFRS